MPKVRLRVEAESCQPEKLPTLQDTTGCSPEGIVYKMCKRGHVKSPDNVSNVGSCKECLRANQKTPAYKAYQKKYHKKYHQKKYNRRKTTGCNQEGIVYNLCKLGHLKSPDNVSKDRSCKTCKKILSQSLEWRQKQKATAKRYAQSPESRQKREEYNHSPERKAHVKAYRQLPERKARTKEYNSSEKRRASVKGARQRLDQWYVCSRLSLHVNDVSPELIELKRAHIQLQREIKNANSQNHA